MDIKGKVSAELEEFIELAGTNGQFTQKQKELILKKAESLGEDMDVVEMILEGVTVEDRKKQSRLQKKGRQCPQCGAYWDESVIKCSECGHVFQTESDKSAQIRKELDRLSKKLEDSFPDEEVPRITIPSDKESLLSYMEFFCSNAEAAESGGDMRVWLAKANECYNKLFRMSTTDPDLKPILSEYKSQLSDLKDEQRKKEKEEEKEERVWNGCAIVGIIVILVIIFMWIF